MARTVYIRDDMSDEDKKVIIEYARAASEALGLSKPVFKKLSVCGLSKEERTAAEEAEEESDSTSD